jgi:hypothetical protein
VQEAKEIPTVKVLDAPIVPTKKSYPPRTMIVILGTMLGITLAMTWIVGKTWWEAVEVSDPRRVFAMEVFTTVQARMPKFSRNGTGAETNGHRAWSWRERPDAMSEQDQDKDAERDEP